MTKNNFDAIIIGAGHAGVEASLALARLSFRVLVLTMSVDNIAFMPCNPHIGGSSKGHLVREIDALGGEMGKAIDHTFLQSKMLNLSKGPAVHSLRAQADKQAYSGYMRARLEENNNIFLKQAEVVEILAKDGAFRGVTTASGLSFFAPVCILCTGTYLNARCLTGEHISHTGPNGMAASVALSESLKRAGLRLRRFKTGTPARMDGNSLDYSKMEIQEGDIPVVPFSFDTDPSEVQIQQVPCYLTYTNEKTHDILKSNLHRSPIYAGVIEGIGPRYCPSIEDKVVKFPDKIRHQVFVEPEGLYTNEKYIDGMSSSMPEDVQEQFYKTVPGLEDCRIVKPAYAIEYDCLESLELTDELESKALRGFFTAGQFNGSSGYEEAAAQGLYAALQVAAKLRGTKGIRIDRSEGYIGVLVDDLVHKQNSEPYRMMTGRAEYRLLLRQDNADLRLREKGYDAGLISPEKYNRLLLKKEQIATEIKRLRDTHIGTSAAVQNILRGLGSSPIATATPLSSLLCRPELDYQRISSLDPKRQATLTVDVIRQVEISLKYAGYIERQELQVAKFKKLESRMIPKDFDYHAIKGLRIEAVQKLSEIRPSFVGEASRISGVNPADINVLLIYMKAHGI